MTSQYTITEEDDDFLNQLADRAMAAYTEPGRRFYNRVLIDKRRRLIIFTNTRTSPATTLSIKLLPKRSTAQLVAFVAAVAGEDFGSAGKSRDFLDKYTRYITIDNTAGTNRLLEQLSA